MAIVTTQVSNTSNPALNSSTAVVLAVLPPGPCNVAISNTSGQTVFIGTVSTPATLTAEGFSIPNNAPPVSFIAYEGSRGATLYAIAGGAPTGGVSALVSTDS